ncbi:hypothetical protein LIER_11484 [Lithospermum erythrorhizon]|uniref:Uncharacterized protein n=1 Tax=Lithospermum erythrorhizon TaxID=34254 RepID=A0AAV3PPS8_LITER
MKKVEQGGEGGAKKEENLGEKLKRVGKKGVYGTPVIPFWRLQHHHKQQSKVANIVKNENSDNIIQESPINIPSASARKIGATIWELDQYNLPLTCSRMHHQGPPRLRRLNHRDNRPHHHHHGLVYEDSRRGGGGFDPHAPSPSSPDMPDSGGSLRRQVAASLMQHHRAIERNNRAIQPVSPASYGSSLEIAPYNPAVTPSSSVDIKGRVGDPGYSLKTSTELLKVLNRIWSLEEQHASNMSLIKALKKELDNARTHIKELMRNQQVDRQEVGELMKQITENKLMRKSMEQDRIGAAIQSVRDELEDERKLRKRSESLHRKLARDLYEVKTSLATSTNDLEKERKSRVLLEDLCDEFAWGIRDYDQELHTLRHKIDKDWAERTGHDRVILHVSESWLDERMQMKQEAQNGLAEPSIVEKLKPEIETFLEIKKKGKSNTNGNLVQKDPTFRMSSLESIPLNMVTSAPKDEDDENDSSASDSHCFELSKPSHTKFISQENIAVEDHTAESVRPDIVHRKASAHGKTKNRSPSTAQIKFEEHVGQAISPSVGGDVGDMETRENKDGHLGEVSDNRKSEISKSIVDEHLDAKNKAEESLGLNSNFVIDNLLRSHYMLSDSGSMHQPEKDFGLESGGGSVWRNQPSPVRKWSDRLPSHDHDTESSSRVPSELKENTLKAKLIEAKSRGQRSRSRLRG